MRYWAYFAAKLVAAGGLLYGLLGLLSWALPAPVASKPAFDSVALVSTTPALLPSNPPAAALDPLIAHLDMAPLAPGQHVLTVNLALLVWFVVSVGVIYLIYRDQRYRCRVCLRRLRMPVETGSWGSMLRLGRPRVEYICPYGHGTLRADELQISGLEKPEWTRNSDDIWDELCAASKEAGDRK
jgi:hypothetical protein